HVVVPAGPLLPAGSSGRLDVGILRLRLHHSGGPEPCGPSVALHQRHGNFGPGEVCVWDHAGRFILSRHGHGVRALQAGGGAERDAGAALGRLNLAGWRWGSSAPWACVWWPTSR
ncbi:unnamed protein product, partial [Tetraodon nigroviridis]